MRKPTIYRIVLLVSAKRTVMSFKNTITNRCRNLFLFFFLGISFSARSQGLTWIVTDTSDANTGNATLRTGTLRFIMARINTTADPTLPDTIKFDIPDNMATNGYFVLHPTTIYANMQPCYVMGYTQGTLSVHNASLVAAQGPIYSRAIKIVIDGGLLPTANPNMFRVASSASMQNLNISGITFNNLDRAQGGAIRVSANGGNIGKMHVWGCQFGVTPDGMSKSPNTDIGNGQNHRAIDLPGLTGLLTKVFLGTDGDGKNDVNEGNLISNFYSGIFVQATDWPTNADTVFIAGNYIGTDALGTTAIPDSVGITVLRAGKTVIGISNATKQEDTLKRNIISGNIGSAVGLSYFTSQINTFTEAQATTIISGNYIGVDKTGMTAMPNGTSGLNILAPNVRIGTNGDNDVLDTLERNIVSANGTFGISLGGSNLVVAGNYVGTGSDGMTALGNTQSGISASLATNNNIRIGVGTRATERNILSGNGSNGITLAGTNYTVSGNYIGVGKDGKKKIPNVFGILISNQTVFSRGIRIGTAYYSSVSKDIERNIISGNAANGIQFGGYSTNDTISGNYIGVDVDKAPLGNFGAGIVVKNNCDSIIIGAHDINNYSPNEVNIIANNSLAGVTVGNTTDQFRAIRVLVSQNSFYRNGNLPIDLDDNRAVNPNTGVLIPGTNNLSMNYPIITDNSVSGTLLTVAGYVGNCSGNNFKTPGTLISGSTLSVQLYIVDNDGNQNGTDCNAVNVAHGEGRYYLGTVPLASDGTFSTQVNVSARTDLPNLTGKFFTGITIDANNNTSEFGTSGIPDAPLPLTLLSFSGTPYNNYNLIEWTTVDEKNTATFQLLFSMNGRDYQSIVSMPAAGNSSSKIKYLYKHFNAPGNIFYYRLKTIDIDGTASLSNIITLKNNSGSLAAGEFALINASPVPFTNSIKVNYGAGSGTSANVQLLNAAGQVVKSQSVSLVKGYSYFELNGLDYLPSGTYILQINTVNSNKYIKVLKSNK